MENHEHNLIPLKVFTTDWGLTFLLLGCLVLDDDSESGFCEHKEVLEGEDV